MVTLRGESRELAEPTPPQAPPAEALGSAATTLAAPAAPPAPTGSAVPRSWPARALAAVAIVIFLLGAAQALVGATQIGISNDEPLHQQRTNVWMETGWYVPGRFFEEDGQRNEAIDTGRWHSYGASFGIFAHALAAVTGAEEWGTTNRSAAAYDARRVAVALLGVAAALAVGLATTVLARSRLAGLWAAAAAVTIPGWVGYSMFAVKDVPAAAGWTFLTAGLVLALHRFGGVWRYPVLAGLGAAGIYFSVGVRTALWVPIVLSLALFAVLAVVRWHRIRGNLVALGGGLVFGAAGVAAVHYRNAATPVEWLVSSVRTSGDFHWTGTTLTFGRLLSEKPPWWYLPAWIGGSVPELIGALAAAGVLAALIAFLLPRTADGRSVPEQRRAGTPLPRRIADGTLRRLRGGPAVVSLWCVQAMLLPVVATAGNATMYAGMRQHLYVLPAVAALAGYAVARLIRAWGNRLLVPALLAAALLIPAVEQLALHPFQFVYKNTLAGSVTGRWETDMHFVSGREALRRVPAEATAWCSTKTPRVPLEVAECPRKSQLRPFGDEQGSDAVAAPQDEGEWLIMRQYRDRQPPAGCTDAGSVTRWLRGEQVLIAHVVRCPADLLDR